MAKKKINENDAQKKESLARAKKYLFREAMVAVVGIIVIATLVLFWTNAFHKGDVAGGILGIILGITLLFFHFFVYREGNKDLKAGLPLEDERSKRVKEKATSKAFYVSLYLLLIIGMLSDNIIRFRDVSQAISASVGGMAILFAAFWLYYNKREI